MKDVQKNLKTNPSLIPGTLSAENVGESHAHSRKFVRKKTWANGFLTPSQLETRFRVKLLGFSIGKGYGVLKGLTPLQLEPLLGDKFTWNYFREGFGGSEEVKVAFLWWSVPTQ